MCQGACCKAVGRAICRPVCMCTTHTGKRNSCVIVAAGAATRGGGGLAVYLVNCEFVRPSLGINWETLVVTMAERAMAGMIRAATCIDVASSISIFISLLTSAITILPFTL